MMALLLGAVGLFLMSWGPGEGQEVVNCPENVPEDDVVCIEFPEHGSGTVAAYIATDPEMETVTWMILGNLSTTSADAAAFKIDPITGVLTFMDPPDFEAPMDIDDENGVGEDQDNIYRVVIEARDSRPNSGIARDAIILGKSQALAIIITNEEEPGEVTLETLQPQVDTEISATLMDPDGRRGITPLNTVLTGNNPSDVATDTTNTVWKWARSSRATGPWTDIEIEIEDDTNTANVDESKVGTPNYTPADEDLGMYLRATATYNDGQGEDKTAQAVSAFPVQPDPANKAPVFKNEEGDTITTTTRSVAENSEAGTVVGAPVAATDIGADGRQQTLTYGLSGDGDELFAIDPRSGQITVKGKLDADTKDEYKPSVTATDPSGLSNTDTDEGGSGAMTLTINVINLDEAPTIAAATANDGLVTKEVEENTPADEPVSTYTATDPDGDDEESLKWTLSGKDAGSFWIGNFSDERGRLYFRDSPNYEAPMDSGRNNVYEVTVEVTDRGGNKATRDVTVTVKNVDEEGLLTVTNRNPRVGNRIIATLTDPDLPISNVRWTWRVGGTADGSTDTYDPKAGNVGDALEVEVTYTDGTGERRVIPVPLGNITDRPTRSNGSPAFPTNAPSSLSVAENGQADERIGAVTANDPDTDDLTYSMSGGDGAFTIDQDDGDITTTRSLDREKKSSYQVTITAEDPSGGRDTHSLTINVTDVNEFPAIRAGDAPTVHYAENGRASVATYKAVDPEGTKISWSLEGAGAELFTISNSGVLRFKSSPDFEDTDYGGEDGVSFTIIASDGTNDGTDEEEITVKLINVDEAGTATLNHEPREDVEVTASLMDPDDDETSVSWQWARSVSKSGRFIDIENATNAAYTPVAEDVRNYLRATASYTDGQGMGKTASVVSEASTTPKASGPPKFLADDGVELQAVEDTTDTTGKTFTTTLTDATPEIKREIAENSRRGASVGVPVAAMDIGDNGKPETLTYSLADTGDNTKFSIDPRNGQIRLQNTFTPDFEGTGSDNCDGDDDVCTVTVTVRDGSGNNNTVTIGIAITDVDETPILALLNPIELPDGVTGGALNTEYKHPEPVIADNSENPDTGEDYTTSPLSIIFTADDPETDSNTDGTFVGDNDASRLNWTLAGPDADDFVIGNNPATGATEADGTLTFKNGPDFENPTDSRQRNMYDVTVQVTDDAGNTAEQRVRVQVANVGEVGLISLSHTHPEVGAPLRATLTDPDKPSSVRWQWYRGDADTNDDGAVDADANESCSAADASGTCAIDRAISATYRPVTGTGDSPPAIDLNSLLTVAATYRDGDREGSEKTTIATTANNVQAEDTENVPPHFQDGNGDRTTRTTRQIREDALNDSLDGSQRLTTGYSVVGVGTDEVSPVAATDCDGDADCTTNSDQLVYTLSGTDARHFTINAGTGQIMVVAGTDLDYEKKKSYTVRVTALDPSGAPATVTVTIEVLDVDEEPVLSQKGLAALGPGNVFYRENESAAVGQYTASGANAGRVSWTLSGTDASDFSISRDGALTFRSAPNYESPADSDRDNLYEFSVVARSGRVQDEVPVTVEVIDVDEAGTVTLDPQRSTVGSQVEATLEDPDGGITNLVWEWERSLDGIVGWNFIPGATSASYTSTSDDAGHYLRAVAYYWDGEGAGKSASGMTAAAVLRDDDGVVTIDVVRISVGDLLTATLTDPDGSITNQDWRWARSESRSSGWTDIQGATASTYTATASDVTYFLRVSVNYDDGDGVDKTAFAVTARAVAEDDDGDLTLSNASPAVGDTVTATLTDPDGGVTGESWVWASSSDGRINWANIADATGASYTVAAGDLGKFLRATVSYEDRQGSGKSAEAVTSAAVVADDDGVVTLSTSTPQVSDTITARLSDPDGTTTIPSWTWERSPNGTSGWTTVLTGLGATSTLRVSESHLGSYLRATASYTDSAGPGKSAQAVTSGPVTEDDDGMVTLSTRTPEVGSEVTARLVDPDNPRNLRWQWEKSVDGSTWTSIDGATMASYTPGRSDEGAFLRATVNYDDSVGSGKSAQGVTSSGVTQAALQARYDTNGNGSIERSEAVGAVSDYFNDEISKDDVLDVLALYFSS